MQLISPEFEEYLRKGAEVFVRAELWRLGQVVAELPVVAGSVTVDGTAAIRRRCSLTIDPAENPDLIPDRTFKFDKGLWPVGSEVRLFQGIRFPSRLRLVPEELPLGVFRVSSPRISDDGTNVLLTIDGFDRARTVNRNVFTDIYSIPFGQDYATAIKRVLLDRFPYLSEEDFQDWMVTDGSDGNVVMTTPQLVFQAGDGPMDKALEMAQSIGALCYFDVNGRPVLRPEPDPQYDDPVFSYEEGPDAIITSVDRSLDDEHAYNGVILFGENTQNEEPIRGEAWDTDPASPTYYNPDDSEGSAYGANPLILRSEYVSTPEQANRAARAILVKQLGIIEDVSFTGAPNFAHEAGDVVCIKRDRVNVDGNYMIESFDFGLGYSGSMSASTRKRSVQ